MKYIIDHIPLLKGKRCGRKITPTTLTVHSTGNPDSTAEEEVNWLTNPDNKRSASFHVVVDETEAREAIPLDEEAFHSGTSKGNATSISVEICESGDRAKTLDNAAQVIAKMLRDLGWTLKEIRQHFDWSGKNCPRILRQGTLWEGFLMSILFYYKGGKGTMTEQWKLDLIDELHKEGLISDPDQWKAKINDAAPVWMVAALVKKLNDKISK